MTTWDEPSSVLPTHDAGSVQLGDASGIRAKLRSERVRAARRRWRRIALATALVWALLVSYSMVTAIRASGRADDAVTEISADGLAAADAEALRAIQADLAEAGARLKDPWIRPLELVPFLGRQIRAAQTLDDSALEAMRAGADAVSALERARSSSSQTELLNLARVELATARTRLASTLLPSGSFLVPPLANARDRLSTQLIDIDRELSRFQAVAEAFGSLIESDSTYILAAANTSEMGAGTGMLLSMGLITLSGGNVEVADVESVNLLPRPSRVSIPEEIRDRWFSLDPGHIWSYTALLTPRVDEIGRITADMWESIGQPEVAGVMIVNPVALEILLKAGGLETVDLGGEMYPVDVVGRFFGRLQYQLYPDSEERRDVLAPVASAAFGAVFGDSIDPQVLVDAIYEAAEGRHLMAWSRDPEQQQRWERLGMSGSLSSESVMLSVLNSGGNKLDALIEIESDMTWVVSDGQTAVKVEIDIHNTATGGEVDYVAGGVRRSAKAGEYVGYLAVNLPAGATRAEMSGTTATNAAGPDGPTHQLVHILELMPGESASYTLEFDLPEEFRSLTLEPSGRLPSIEWTVQGEAVPDRRQKLLLDAGR